MVLFAVVVLSLSSVVFAEESQPPMGFAVTVYDVAPGQEANFEEVSMKFKQAADRLKTPAYFGFSPAIGNNGRYTFASPFNSFAVFGNPRNVLAEGYEGEELARLGELFQESVVNTDSYIVIPRPDLSVAPPAFDSPREIVLLITVTIKPNKGEQYVDFLEKLVEATKATAPEQYWSTYQPGFGSGPVWRFGISMNWADLDTAGKSIPERLNEHFGKRTGERIYQDSQDATESFEYTVQIIRPDLSHAN
jgi:hypothetical protein